MVPGAESRCFGCQHCLAVCPTGALSWSNKSAEDSAPVEELPSADAVARLIRQRRSVRDYRRENVAPDVLDRLHRAMAFVPTGCNDHRLFFSYSDDLAATDALRRAAADEVIKRIESDTLPESIAHFKKMKAALERGTDIFFRGAPHCVAISVASDAKDAHIDPYIAATTFELLAVSFGLGTCWGGMATDLFMAVPTLLERLSLPPDYQLGIILLFGRPRIEYARTPQPAPCPRVRIQ